MLTVFDRTKYWLGPLVLLLEIQQELLLDYRQGLQAAVVVVQERPGSELLDFELPFYHSPALELGLRGFALELTALEPPGSWLLELDLSVLGPDLLGFELLPRNLAVLLDVEFEQEQLRLPQG